VSLLWDVVWGEKNRCYVSIHLDSSVRQLT